MKEAIDRVISKELTIRDASARSVSYTHLDVYKRQRLYLAHVSETVSDVSVTVT